MTGWKVRLVHGPKHEDEETLSTLQTAMDWASTKGAEYHVHGVDCLRQMQEVFVLEPEGGLWFQYGMNYHWVTFNRI
jgi:hypothetical protein